MKNPCILTFFAKCVFKVQTFNHYQMVDASTAYAQNSRLLAMENLGGKILR